MQISSEEFLARAAKRKERTKHYNAIVSQLLSIADHKSLSNWEKTFINNIADQETGEPYSHNQMLKLDELKRKHL